MKNETDTITVLLAVALEVAEALLVLTVALVALLLTVARWRPSQTPSVPAPAATTDPLPITQSRPAESPARVMPSPPVACTDPLPLVAPAASTDAPQTDLFVAPGGAPHQQRPLLHPLALVAEQLEALPVSRLRPLAGISSKRHRKAELVAALVAC